MPDWFAVALSLENHGRKNAAVSAVFDPVDRMLSAGQFSDVDSFISGLNPERLSVLMIMAVLSITLPACRRLLNRKEFFERAWKSVEARGRDVERLMGRLKSYERIP